MTHASQWNWKERMGQLADAVGATTRERRFLSAYARAILSYGDTQEVRDRFALSNTVGFNVADLYDQLLAQVGLDTVLEMTRVYRESTLGEGYPIFPDDASVDESEVEMFWRERDFDVSEKPMNRLLSNSSELGILRKQFLALRREDSAIRKATMGFLTSPKRR